MQRAVGQKIHCLMKTLNWSSSALTDLDTHLNAPNGSGGTFHVFFGNTGSITSGNGAQLENDCTGGCKSEVITIGNFNSGGKYRVSAFHFANQSTTATDFVDNRSDIFLKINQGGTLTRGSNGSAVITGGSNIIQINPPSSGAGNTWVAANIDPLTGEIQVVNRIINSANSSSVTGVVSD